MPKTVNIPGVGEVDFPDTMADSDIQAAIERDILKTAPKASPSFMDRVGALNDAIGNQFRGVEQIPRHAYEALAEGQGSLLGGLYNLNAISKAGSPGGGAAAVGAMEQTPQFLQDMRSGLQQQQQDRAQESAAMPLPARVLDKAGQMVGSLAGDAPMFFSGPAAPAVMGAYGLIRGANESQDPVKAAEHAALGGTLGAVAGKLMPGQGTPILQSLNRMGLIFGGQNVASDEVGRIINRDSGEQVGTIPEEVMRAAKTFGSGYLEGILMDMGFKGAAKIVSLLPKKGPAPIADQAPPINLPPEVHNVEKLLGLTPEDVARYNAQQVPGGLAPPPDVTAGPIAEGAHGQRLQRGLDAAQGIQDAYLRDAQAKGQQEQIGNAAAAKAQADLAPAPPEKPLQDIPASNPYDIPAALDLAHLVVSGRKSLNDIPARLRPMVDDAVFSMTNRLQEGKSMAEARASASHLLTELASDKASAKAISDFRKNLEQPPSDVTTPDGMTPPPDLRNGLEPKPPEHVRRIIENPRDVPASVGVKTKAETKATLTSMLDSGELADNSPVRLTTVDEVARIADTGVLPEGMSFEGRTGLSGQRVSKGRPIVAYGDNEKVSAALIFPEDAVTGNGQAPSEVLLNAQPDMSNVRVVVDGYEKAMTLDEFRKIRQGEKAAEPPPAEPPPAEPAPPPERRAGADQANADALRTAANKARARLKDPTVMNDATQVLADYATIGAEHLRNGVVKFTEWSRAMLSEFGAKVRPYLAKAWEMAKKAATDERGYFKPGELLPEGVLPEITSVQVAEMSGAKPAERARKGEAPKPTGSNAKPGPEAGFARLGEIGLPLAEKARSFADAIIDKKLPVASRIGNGEVADAFHWHGSARIQTPELTKALIGRIAPTEPEKAMLGVFKTTLDKDNILGLYDQRMAEVKREKAAGNPSKAKAAEGEAQAIAKAHDLPAYQVQVTNAMKNPRIAGMVKNYKEQVQPVLDELYQRTRGLDPNEPLFHRGRNTGVHSNLLSAEKMAEWAQWNRDPLGNPMPTTAGAAGHMNPKVRSDSFAKRAKGTGEYANNLEATLSSVLGPRLNNVSKMAVYDSIVKHGAGYWEDAPPSNPPEGMVRFPVQQPNGQARNLMVQKDLVPELKGVLNTDQRLPSLLPLDIANTLQVSVNPVDAISHIHNLGAELLYAQGYGKSSGADLARKAIPMATTVSTITKLASTYMKIRQGGQPVLEQIARMAGEGTWRPEYKGKGMHRLAIGSKIITVMDQTSRVMMDDLFNEMARRGQVENTPGNRREFVNRLGAYNRRISGNVERAMKDLGIAPFITAGRRMTANAIEQTALSPQVKASSDADAVKMRAINLAGHLSMLMVPAVINSLTVGNPLGRPGTAFGAIDLGRKKDEKGKFFTLDPLQWLGFRRGLRVVGANALYAGLRSGQNASQIAGAMGEESAQSFIHPWMGPGAGFVYKALTGRSLDLRGYMEAANVPKHQKIENMRAALESQNPPLYAVTKPAIEKLYERLGIPYPDRGATKPNMADKMVRGTKLASVPGVHYATTVLESPVKAVAGAFGVKEARAGQSAAEQTAQEYVQAKMPEARPPGSDQHTALRDALRSGAPDAKARLRAAVKAGDISQGEAVRLMRSAADKTPQLGRAFKRLNLDEAFDVMKEASADEKKMLTPLLAKKLTNGLKNLTPDQRKTYLAMYRSLKGTQPK